MSKFQIFKDSRGEFRFRLKAMNGEIILSSESYITKDSCFRGITSVKSNASDSDRYEKRNTKSGQHYFVLKALNGQIIGVSEIYSSKAGIENGIYSVKRNALNAGIEDHT